MKKKFYFIRIDRHKKNGIIIKIPFALYFWFWNLNSQRIQESDSGWKTIRFEFWLVEQRTQKHTEKNKNTQKKSDKTVYCS